MTRQVEPISIGRQRRQLRRLRRCLVALAVVSLAGCANFTTRRQGPESAPIIRGPAITDNSTLLEPVFACYQNALARRSGARAGAAEPISISVGEVRDFTGKSSINEGAALTQGGTLMVMSALGRLAPAVRIHERFDPRVAELELIYADRRQLGDGRAYAVPGGAPGQQQRVPWMPYAGGSIQNSRYFIVGGITELNWNVQSGGIDARTNGVGPSARTFTASIAADLRIVDTRSLVVLRTVSLQKQVTGHEVEMNIFRFFGSRLFDISGGMRNQEPIQLAVRATLELGVLELLSSVSGVSFQNCAGPAIEAGIMSAGYEIAPPRALPQPFVPAFVPAPIADEVQAAPTPEPPPAPPAQRDRPAPAARTTSPGSAPDQRPDSASRPPLPPHLQGPQLLAPPGSSNTPPGGVAPSRPPMLPPIGIWPDPQRQSAPASSDSPRAGEGAPESLQPLGAAPTRGTSEPPPAVAPMNDLGSAPDSPTQEPPPRPAPLNNLGDIPNVPTQEPPARNPRVRDLGDIPVAPTREPPASVAPVRTLGEGSDEPTQEPPARTPRVRTLGDIPVAPTREPPSNVAPTRTLGEGADEPTQEPPARPARTRNLGQAPSRPTREPPAPVAPANTLSSRQPRDARQVAGNVAAASTRGTRNAEGAVPLSSFMDRTLLTDAEAPSTWRDALLTFDPR